MKAGDGILGGQGKKVLVCILQQLGKFPSEFPLITILKGHGHGFLPEFLFVAKDGNSTSFSPFQSGSQSIFLPSYKLFKSPLMCPFPLSHLATTNRKENLKGESEFKKKK